MQTIAEYICKRRNTIAVHVGARPILEAFREGKQKRGLMPRQWWWEQPMSFDVVDALGLDTESNLAASLAEDGQGNACLVATRLLGPQQTDGMRDPPARHVKQSVDSGGWH